MITATKRLRFCAAHRLVGHEGACAQVHGHNYVVDVTVVSETGLDKVGRVVDFSVLKEELGGWINECWDHKMLVWQGDDSAPIGERVFALPNNPTAEVMAQYLLNEVCDMVLVGTGVRVIKVRLWETESSYVEAIRDQ
jgi:6-pyruvoyltetrahydropterin/6-carboxytetrahydropterin synthase